MGSMGTGRVARAQGPLRRWETDPAEHGCRDRPVTGERNRIVTAGGIKAGRDRSRPTAPLPPLQLRTRTFSRHFNDIPFPDDPVGQLPSPSPQRSHLGNNCVARAAPGHREDCRPRPCRRVMARGHGKCRGPHDARTMPARCPRHDPHHVPATRATRTRGRIVRAMARSVSTTRTTRGARTTAVMRGPRMCCHCQAL